MSQQELQQLLDDEQQPATLASLPDDCLVLCLGHLILVER